MSADTSPSLSQELPQHAAWVRRLARRLVRDEAAAEDVAQDVVLAALRAPPPAEARRPWLARVAGNLAKRAWRTEGARAESERAAAREEGVPGADETAARLELVRLLAEELGRLEEPYRVALVRRFFDGHSAARIAREAGVPAPTVRWRIQRGLAELRARLDRRHGGDGVQWRLALVPLARGPWPELVTQAGPALVGAAQGVLAMKLSSQVVAAGALVLALGLGVLWQQAPGDAIGAEEPVAPRAAEPVALAAPPEVRDAPVLVAAEREIVPSTEPAPAEPPAPAAAAGAGVDGRLVDQGFVPVPDATISDEGADEGAAGEVARSQGDGSFALACPGDPGDPLESGARTLRVEARGFGTRFLEARVAAGAVTHLGDVVLAPGGSVVGRVLDELGAPVAEALVTVTGTELWDDFEAARRHGPDAAHALTARSGRDGHFRVEDVPAGMVRVWGSAPGRLHALTGAVEVPAHGETAELELVLEPSTPADRIAGIVLDPEGAPVPHASFQCIRNAKLGMRSSSLAADEDGHFELAAARDSTYDLYVADPEGRWLQIERMGVTPGTVDLELVFSEWKEFELLVRGEGEPVEEYAAYVFEVENDSLSNGDTRVGPHPGGRVRLLSARLSFRVRVDAPGFAVAEQGPFDPASPPTRLEFELEPVPGLHGRVSAYGEPLAGATVGLFSWVTEQHIEHGGYPAWIAPYELMHATSDADGRFLLSPRTRGTFVVRAEAAGLAAGDSGPLVLDPALDYPEVELALTHGGALEGRVLVAPEREAEGVIVALNRGDAHPRTQRAGPDGSFRFEGLTPGEWSLTRGKVDYVEDEAGTSHSLGKPAEIPFNCRVADGENTHQDLDLREWMPCAIAGELRINGAPASGWLLKVWPGDTQAVSNPLPSTATDEHGRFTLEVDDAGPARFAFNPPVREGGQGNDISTQVVLVAGTNTWRGDFAMGRVEGTLAPVHRERLLFYVSGEGVEPETWLAVEADAEGRFTLPYAATGPGSIRWLDQGDGRYAWSTLLELDVPARGTRVVDVP